MVTVIRTKFVVAVAVVMTALLGFLSPITSVVVKLTATALYMGGTGSPLSIPQQTQSFISGYINRAETNYVLPSGMCTGGNSGVCDPGVAVYGPEQFRLWTGLFDMTFNRSRSLGLQNLDACLRSNASCTRTLQPYGSTGQGALLADSVYTVFGYSQSSAIASLEKAGLIANPIPVTNVNFVMLANPNRPNGGILARFAGLYIPIIGVGFNGATPTASDPTNPLTTVDVTRQYDAVSDFPNNPLNLLSVLNAVLGTIFLHSNYNNVGTPELQGQYQDTTYYMIPTDTLPLLMPVKAIPIIGPLVATALDPFLRVLVEAGYDRTLNPGVPAAANLFYFHPLRTLLNLLAAIPVAIDNVLSYLAGNPAYRPFGTTPPGPFGVGGPPVNAGAIDPYGPPTPALMAAPAPMLMSLSGSADLSASDPLMTSRSMALFSVEPDPMVVEEDASLLTEPTDLTVQTESPVTTDPTASVTADPTASVTTDPTPSATSDPTVSATTDPTPSATADPTPSATADPEPSATTEPKPSATTESTPSATVDPKPSTLTDPKTTTLTDPKTSTTTDPKTSSGTESTPSGGNGTTSGTDSKTTDSTDSKTTSSTDSKTTSGTDSNTSSSSDSKTSSDSAAAA